MVLNGKSDPRDTTHPAVRMHTLTDFQLYVQNMGRSVTFLGSPGEERHKVFVWSLSFIFIILHRTRLFLTLINLNFYRQRSMYRNWVVPLPSLVPLVRKDTRYLFGARLLFLQYYIVHVCF